MPINDVDVQECDATGDDSSTKADLIKIISTFFKYHFIETKIPGAGEKENQAKEHQQKRMLILIPDFSMPDKERDIRHGDDQNKTTNSCK